MKDGDLHLRLQPLLDLEALRRGDVFEVDAAKRRLHDLDGVDELLGVTRVELEIENVDVREALEEDGLSFHHRLAGSGADVAKSQDRGAVGDDRDEIALVRVLVDVAGLARDLEAGLGHARRVRERKIALRRGRLGRHDLRFSGTPTRVIFESVIAVVVWHEAGESIKLGSRALCGRRSPQRHRDHRIFLCVLCASVVICFYEIR